MLILALLLDKKEEAHFLAPLPIFFLFFIS